METHVADPDDNRLGAIMVRSGGIAQSDVEYILGRQRSGGGLFGEIAVDMGLVTIDQITDALRLQNASRVPSIGPECADPMVVTAFDLDNPYSRRMRAIRASIVRHAGRNGGNASNCALIGVNSDLELAVLAANLATLFVRMGTSTLLVDGGRNPALTHDLFRTESASEGEGAVSIQKTRIPHLLLGSIPGNPQGMPERKPLIRAIDDASLTFGQLLVTTSYDEAVGAPVVAERLSGMTMAILVLRRHVTEINRTRTLIDALDDRQVPLIGTILV